MKSRRKKITVGIAFALAMVLVLGLATAQAIDELGLFELDRNALDSNAFNTAPDDWNTLYLNTGFARTFTGILPDIGAPGNQFQAGGSKDNNDITQWLWKPGEPLDKDDITNAYAAAYTYQGAEICDTGFTCATDVNRDKCQCPGDLIIYYGLDRLANNGSAQVGFWFFQNTIGLTNTPTGGGFRFSGAHAIGDILIQSNFTQGGEISSISIYKWVGSGGSNDTLDLVFSAADCLAGAESIDPACATVNQGNTPSPWPYTPKSGTAGTFPQGSFFEGGINITRLVPEAVCFSSVMAETRTSTPFDSRLKDFVLGSFKLCGIDISKKCGTTEAQGETILYTNTITVKNTGAFPLHDVLVTDEYQIDSTTTGKHYFSGVSGCFGNSPCTVVAALEPLTADVNITESFSSTLLTATDNATVEAAIESGGARTFTAGPGSASCSISILSDVTVVKNCDLVELVPVTVDGAQELAVKVTVSGTIRNDSSSNTDIIIDSITDSVFAGSIPLTKTTLAQNETTSFGPYSYFPSVVSIGECADGTKCFTDVVTVDWHAVLGGGTTGPDTGQADCPLCVFGCEQGQSCQPTTATPSLLKKRLRKH